MISHGNAGFVAFFAGPSKLIVSAFPFRSASLWDLNDFGWFSVNVNAALGRYARTSMVTFRSLSQRKVCGGNLESICEGRNETR